MIIRDLEHCEIGTQVKEFEAVEGGRFSFLLAKFNSISIGNFTAVTATVDTINQHGDPTTGSPSIAGFSFAVQALSSYEPFAIG